MAGFRQPEIPREQMVLWSQRLEDAIPADHPVRQVDALLKSEAFGATFREWERGYVLLEGKPPYHPRDLSGLYIYGMLNRIRSSRQLESACCNRLDVIWLMSGQRPDHSTIAAFVKDHGQSLRKLFRDVLQVAVRAGLVKLEHVAIDGTKIEADAGKGSVHKAETIAQKLAKVDAQVAALEEEWAENETRETNLFGDAVPWSPPGKGTMAERMSELKRQQERLSEALASIARREAEHVSGRPPKAIASVTDPSSRVMPDKEGKRKPNYNTQIATDTTAGVVVAEDVNDRTDDSGQMTPLLEQVEMNGGTLPQEVSADSQYNTGPELEKLEQLEVVGYLPDNGKPSECPREDTPSAQALAAAQSGAVLSDAEWDALPKDSEGRIIKGAFRYDADADVYVCPMGEVLPFVRNSQDRKNWGLAIRAQYGNCSACAACPRAGVCCRDPSKGRTISRDQYEGHREQMRHRLKTPEGRLRYRLRRQTVEPQFGYIKQALGVRRFLHRGLEAVRTEWCLICTVANVGILLRHWAEVTRWL
jgi:transposase